MTENALARRTPTAGIAPPDLTDERVDLIRRSIAIGLNQTEFETFVAIARHSRLDPMAKELFVWKDQNRLVVHTGIEGLRLIAERSEEYRGMDGPEFCGPDGKWTEVWTGPGLPVAARVIVYREGRRPARAVVHMAEFRKEKSDAWQRRPVHMLGIRAEGHALRKAFRAESHALRVDWNEDEAQPSSEVYIANPEGRPSNDQQAWLHIFAAERGWEREERHERAAAILGHPIDPEAGFASLTKREASILRSAWEDGELVEDSEGEASSGDTRSVSGVAGSTPAETTSTSEDTSGVDVAFSPDAAAGGGEVHSSSDPPPPPPINREVALERIQQLCGSRPRMVQAAMDRFQPTGSFAFADLSDEQVSDWLVDLAAGDSAGKKGEA